MTPQRLILQVTRHASRFAAALLLLEVVAGCAHDEADRPPTTPVQPRTRSKARCDHRPITPVEPPPGITAQEREEWYRLHERTLQTVRQLYRKGMASFAQPGSETDVSALCGIHSVLFDSGAASWILQQPLEDGSWAFRCDELTTLWALGNYHCAVELIDYTQGLGGTEDAAHEHFCHAISARPDVVFELAEKEGLSPTARRIFEAEKARCFIEGGWRSDFVPRPPSPSAGSGRPIDWN